MPTTSTRPAPTTAAGAPAPAPDDPPARGIGSRWPLVLATSLGFGVVQLDVSVVNVAIRPIGEALGGGVSALQWVVNAYTVVFAALILGAGALGDRLGARRVFAGGFAVFTTASVACAAAPTLAALVSARAVQGVGAAALVPSSLALLNHAFPAPADRARAVGLWAAGASVGVAAGPLVGGLLTEAVGWRSVFLINAPVGVAGIAMTLRWATETSRDRDGRLDAPGQVLATATLALVAAAAIEGGVRGFADPFVLAGFGAAAAAGAAFVAVEARVARPLLPLGLFRSRTFAVATALGLVLNVAFYGLIFALSLVLQDAQGRSALGTGIALVPAAAAVTAGNLLAGRVVARVGARRTVTGSALLLAAGLAALLGAGRGTGLAALAGPFAAIGLGLGLVVPVMTSTLLGSVPPGRSGIAAGTLNTARQAGSVLGVAVYGSILAGAGLVPGLHVVAGVSIVLALLAAALGLVLGAEDR